MKPHTYDWVIEAPGNSYLGLYESSLYDSSPSAFCWVKDSNEALRFSSLSQCRTALKALKAAIPALFAFGPLLGDASTACKPYREQEAQEEQEERAIS